MRDVEALRRAKVGAGRGPVNASDGNCCAGVGFWWGVWGVRGSGSAGAAAVVGTAKPACGDTVSTSRPGGERVLRAQDELLAVFGEAGSLLVYLSFPETSPRAASCTGPANTRWPALVAGQQLGPGGVLRAGLDHQFVRYEPMVVVLPEGRRSGAIRLAVFLVDMTSKSRHLCRSPSGTRGSGRSWPRCGTRSSPWWIFRSCPKRSCAHRSSLCLCHRCPLCGVRGWCTRNSTRFDGRHAGSRSGKGGREGPPRDGFQPSTRPSFGPSTDTWPTHNLLVRYIRAPSTL